MKSNDLFKRAFVAALQESNAAGAGGGFGDAGSMGFGGAVTPAEDFYAPGDTRIPMGGKKKEKKREKKKQSGKKRRDGSISPLIPMQSRPLTRSM